MTLSETGESRLRGYLYVLERSISASASAPVAHDAVREVESHIRDRVSESDGLPNERDALEAILERLGSPATVARAYSLELIMEEAATGGRFVPVLRSIFQAAALGVRGFFFALLLFLGYTTGLGFLSIAVMKPIFPDNVGLWVDDGVSLGGKFPAPPDATPLGGYWIVPMCLFVGLLLLIVTHRAARRWAGRLRDRLRERSLAAE
jgi:uncharacterized membrane protein